MPLLDLSSTLLGHERECRVRSEAAGRLRRRHEAPALPASGHSLERWAGQPMLVQARSEERGARSETRPPGAAAALAIWPARATVRAETVGRAVARAVGRRRAVDCVAGLLRPAGGSLLLALMYQVGRFARHRSASARSRCSSHPPRSQHTSSWRKTMATGTVEWFSDDKGFGPGRPRWGRTLRARPTRETAFERRVQHPQVGHLPADIRR